MTLRRLVPLAVAATALFAPVASADPVCVHDSYVQTPTERYLLKYTCTDTPVTGRPAPPLCNKVSSARGYEAQVCVTAPNPF